MTNTEQRHHAGTLLSAHALGDGIRHLGDFTANPRILIISAIAVLVGSGGVLAGIVLLWLIRVATNLAYFGTFSTADLYLGESPLGLFAVLVPVAGALIIGLMARFGSEKISRAWNPRGN